jgi:hypothetical protein
MPPEVAGRCEFCGVQIVAQPKSADPILTPGGVLPFCITQQQASAELRHWLSSRWFAPSGLKHFAQPEAIHGVYLPFWTYDTNTTTYYTGQRGEHYYETETYYERGATHATSAAHALVSRLGNGSQRIRRCFDSGDTIVNNPTSRSSRTMGSGGVESVRSGVSVRL